MNIYEKRDKYLKGGKIITYVDWCKKIEWYESEKLKEEKSIELNSMGSGRYSTRTRETKI